MVANKAIQEQRMKGYFIQATKDILKGEGLKGVSVRNVAQQAGYSYSTIYNYFKDVNDLVFVCISDFQQECASFVADQAQSSAPGIDRLKKLVVGYVNFFVEYPGLFELFYLAKVGDFGHKEATINVINSSLDAICEKEWNYCIARGMVKAADVERLKAQLRYMVIGLLLLYLNRRFPASYSEFMNQLTIQINAILGSETSSGQTAANTAQGGPLVQNSLISVNIK
ncbi:TetR/AcrR family transcriptional regulator [Paludibacter jiangxiensis]|uniref:DNA-binding transcriptional regulator, AcrR family n=1 Tax=Paludibacter jiangxiensis TaxID=681398 RepID=A0A161LIY9_9BACT|nr:TetR/AcrR family transcriptional regulator [Paludibacter jiangxiensis]GAT62486.1 DNA-binding transcriptional regulator, AcrR family [Paludibacter jiangxiensis]